MYMAKSSSELAKKARVGRSPRPILGCGNRRDTDNTTHSIQEINPPHCTERVTDFQVDNVDISVSNEASTRNVQSTAGSNEDGRRIEQDVVGAAREWSDVLGNDHVGRDGDDGGKKEEIVVSCSQSNGSTSHLNEGRLF